MTVPSFQFLAFAIVGAAVFNLFSAPRWRTAVLLIVNLLFFASQSAGLISIIPFVGFLAFGFLSVEVLQRKSNKTYAILLGSIALAGFFWLKKYSFVPEELLLAFPYVTVGLSYVFFRVLHVIIDVQQRAITNRIGLLDYINYTLNFTSLVSGPIQNYQDYHRMQAEEPLELTEVVVAEAFERIISGFFKVSVVSVALRYLHNFVTADVGSDLVFVDRVAIGALTTAVYPIYLYFNFSGYVDAVIGTARLFRIKLPENFDRPFSAVNFIEFWSRWHITLSVWLKTYVYNQLVMLMMKRARVPMFDPFIGVVAFFVTFFLVGAWHGQTAEFLFFGVLQGGGVATNKLYQIVVTRLLGRKQYQTLSRDGIYRTLSRGLTFTWFAFTLLWFWSDWQGIGLLAQWLGVAGMTLAAVAVVGCAVPLLSAGEVLYAAIAQRSFLSSRYLRAVSVTMELVTLLALYIVLYSPAPQIVYRAF